MVAGIFNSITPIIRSIVKKFNSPVVKEDSKFSYAKNLLEFLLVLELSSVPSIQVFKSVSLRSFSYFATHICILSKFKADGGMALHFFVPDAELSGFNLRKALSHINCPITAL